MFAYVDTLCTLMWCHLNESVEIFQSDKGIKLIPKGLIHISRGYLAHVVFAVCADFKNLLCVSTFMKQYFSHLQCKSKELFKFSSSWMWFLLHIQIFSALLCCVSIKYWNNLYEGDRLVLYNSAEPHQGPAMAGTVEVGILQWFSGTTLVASCSNLALGFTSSGSVMKLCWPHLASLFRRHELWNELFNFSVLWNFPLCNDSISKMLLPPKVRNSVKKKHWKNHYCSVQMILAQSTALSDTFWLNLINLTVVTSQSW